MVPYFFSEASSFKAAVITGGSLCPLLLLALPPHIQIRGVGPGANETSVTDSESEEDNGVVNLGTDDLGTNNL